MDSSEPTSSVPVAPSPNVHDNATRIAQEAAIALENTFPDDDNSSDDNKKGNAKGGSAKRRRGRRGGANRKRRSSGVGADGSAQKPYGEMTWEEHREREERATVSTVVRRLSGMVNPPRGKRGKGQGRRAFNADAVRPSAPLVTTQDIMDKKESEEIHWSNMDSLVVEEPQEDETPYGFEEQYNTNQEGPQPITHDSMMALPREELVSIIKELSEKNEKLMGELVRVNGATHGRQYGNDIADIINRVAVSQFYTVPSEWRVFIQPCAACGQSIPVC